jgi:hypothetical protein
MDTSTNQISERLRSLLPEGLGLKWGMVMTDVLDILSGYVVSVSTRRATVLVNRKHHDLLFDQDQQLTGIRHRAFESRSIPEDKENSDTSRIYEETMAAYAALVREYCRALGQPSFSGGYEPYADNGYPENAGGDWLSRWFVNGTFYQVEVNSELEGGPIFVYESARKAARSLAPERSS